MLPSDGPVELSIYDVTGRLVRTLVSETQTTGPHQVVWNGRDDAGRAVASGVYMARLQSGTKAHVRKMSLIK